MTVYAQINAFHADIDLTRYAPYLSVYYILQGNSALNVKSFCASMVVTRTSGDEHLGIYAFNCTVSAIVHDGTYYVEINAQATYASTYGVWVSGARASLDSGEKTIEVKGAQPPLQVYQPPTLVSWSVFPQKVHLNDWVYINISVSSSIGPGNLNNPYFTLKSPGNTYGSLAYVSWSTYYVGNVGNVVKYQARAQLTQCNFWSCMGMPTSTNYTLSVQLCEIGCTPYIDLPNALHVVGQSGSSGRSMVTVYPKLVSFVASPPVVSPGDVLTLTVTLENFYAGYYSNSYTYWKEWWRISPCGFDGKYLQVSGNIARGVYEISCYIGTNWGQLVDGMYHVVYSGCSNNYADNTNYINYYGSCVYSSGQVEVKNAYEPVTAAPTISDIAVSATAVKPGNIVTVTASVFDARGVTSVKLSSTPVLFATKGAAVFYNVNKTADGTWSSSFVIAEDAPNGPVTMDFNVMASNVFKNNARKTERVTFIVSGGKGGSSGGSGGGSKPSSSGAKHPGTKGHGTGSSSGSSMHKHWSTSTSGGSKGGASVNVGVGVNVDINA